MSGTAAYKKAGYTGAGADRSASRLLGNAEISEYLEFLRKESEKSAIVSRAELLEFFSKGLRTPVGEIDEMSPLAQEVLIEKSSRKTTKKVNMSSKVECGKELAKLEGWHGPQKVELGAESIGELLSGILKKS